MNIQRLTIYYQSPIGLIQISGTHDYISSIQFVQENSVEKNINKNSLLQECSMQIDEYFKGVRRQFDLPVKQDGTVFQQTIWKFLQEIPFGQTVTYLDLAKRFGDVKAVRAVGAANGKNKIPILVPCHRVIGSNGKLMGFAYGIERKKYLLQLEKSEAQTEMIFF